MSELKALPCPFCGKAPYVAEEMDPDEWWFVACRTPGCILPVAGGCTSIESAIARWNRRPTVADQARPPVAWKTTHPAVCVPITESRVIAEQWRAHGWPVAEWFDRPAPQAVTANPKSLADDVRVAALCDGQYVAGLKAGFMLGDRGDNDGLAKAIDSRAGYVAVLRETRNAPKAVTEAMMTEDSDRIVPIATFDRMPKAAREPYTVALVRSPQAVTRDDVLEEAARVCDLMLNTSPRKQYQDAAAWLASRIRKLKERINHDRQP